MKKSCIIFLQLFIITITAVSFLGCKAQGQVGREIFAQECLRLHVRADSNDEKAQAVKYLVRDKIVEYLTPFVAEYQTQEQAVQGVKGQEKQLQAVAEKVLKEQGFSYGASAKVEKQTFPTRKYGNYTFPSGEYLALIIELGSGKGDNWWCVVYPPLCFTSAHGEKVIYKSKIAEIIEKWRNT